MNVRVDNIPLSMAYGCQSMSAPMRRVIMHRPGHALRNADPEQWHYGPQFDAEKAIGQHEEFAAMVEDTGAEIVWLDSTKAGGLADAMFTHDPSLVTDKGAILLGMGKPLRNGETPLHEAAYEAAGVPIMGRVDAPGAIEGGDCIWLDAKTLVIGRGMRSNEAGIRQMRDLLAPHDIEVLGFDLPLWKGEEACLHLMSVISPLADDLYLVHAPLLPTQLYQLIKSRGIEMIEAPESEFIASNGLSLNVLPTAPRDVIAVAGFDDTKKLMEEAGCNVRTFEADALCIACEGGPTCLTRPVLRQA